MINTFFRQLPLAWGIMLSLFGSGLAQAASEPQPTIAIIIDDIGNHFEKGQQLIELPFPLTFAFLPERTHTQKLAKLARQHGQEIMLHAPMENTQGIGLGKGGLRLNMSEAQIRTTLIKSLRAVPNVLGVNNHMGSLLTTHPKSMQWVMKELSHYQLYFVDSRTSAQSVAASTALAHNIPTLRRDIFLDHKPTRKFVQTQFLKLIEMARQNGTAIAIGHPHSVTIEYLSWALPRLDEKGVRIATASAIWQIRHPSEHMFPAATQARHAAAN